MTLEEWPVSSQGASGFQEVISATAEAENRDKS